MREGAGRTGGVGVAAAGGGGGVGGSVGSEAAASGGVSGIGAAGCSRGTNTHADEALVTQARMSKRPRSGADNRRSRCT